MFFGGKRWALAMGLVTMLVAPVAMAAVVDIEDATLPTGRVGASAVWTGSRALILGGWDGGYLDEIASYDPVTDQVEVLGATLPSARAWSGVVWSGNVVYLFGGLGPSGPLDEIVSYHPGTGVVSTLAATLPSARWAVATAWEPGGPFPVPMTPTAYIGGGCVDDPCSTRTDELLTFTADGGIVVRGETLPTARSHFSAAWSGARITFFGGRDSAGLLDEIVEYEPNDRVVRITTAALPTPRAEAAIAFDNSQSNYILGGCLDDLCDERSSDIVLYQRDGFRVIDLGYAQLPSPLSGAGVIWENTFNAAIYTFGGEAPGGLSASILRFKPDRAPPRTSISLDGVAGDNGWFRSPVEVTLSAEDDVSGVKRTSFSVDGAPYAEYAGPFTIEDDGDHGLTVFSEDLAGNLEGPHGVGVRIDATPPDVALVRPSEGNAYVRNMEDPVPAPLPITLVVDAILLDAAAVDATSGVAFVEFIIDGEVRITDRIAPYQYYWRAGDAAIGEHAIALRARDVAGNEAFSSELHVITVPTTPEGIVRSVPAPPSQAPAPPIEDVGRSPVAP